MIGVIGCGLFGSNLAYKASQNQQDVKVYCYDRDLLAYFEKHRIHPHFSHLNSKLPESVSFTDNLADLNKMEYLILAVPTQSLRSVFQQLKTLGNQSKLINAAKGIEIGRSSFAHEIASELLRPEVIDRFSVLSGPSFAEELAQDFPTAVVVASRHQELCQEVQSIFHTHLFRVYSSDDYIGVEIAGALKNVYAIASGCLDGLGFKSNTRASLICRGLAEMARLGQKFGANPLTFQGLAGVGDLVLTCSSEQSRNYTLGKKLTLAYKNKNVPPSESLKETPATGAKLAEGYFTTKAVYDLAAERGIDMPIVTKIYQVLYENKNLDEAFKDLLGREPKPETDIEI